LSKHGFLRLGDWRRPLLLGAAVLLTACQPQSESKAESAAEATSEAPLTPSPYGHYLAARQAEVERDNGRAADLLAVTIAEDPDNLDLLNESFLLLASEGRIDEAAAAAERIDALDPKSPTAGMVRAARDMIAGDYKTADVRLAKLSPEGVNRLVLPMARAWLTLANKGPDEALKVLDELKAIPGLEPMVHLHAGAILDVANRIPAAEAEFKQLVEAEGTTLRVVEIVGNFYQRHGTPAQARAVYDKFLAENPQSTSLEVPMAALAAGKAPAPVIADVRDGLAETFFNLASILSREEVIDTAMVFLRVSLALKPDYPIAQTLLGEMLAGQGRTADSVAAYRKVAPDSSFAWPARLEVAKGLDEIDRTDEAIAMLRAMIEERKDRSDAATTLGNILRSHERFEEAAAAYDIAVARIEKPRPENWPLFYSRGIALERIKQWDRAEVDFKRALELEPEQPYVMNYLAYSWIEQGRHFDEALKMLERAVDLKPEDGYIVDSLGWVYYRLGQYDKAVVTLERAVELEPADPTITDHLGDAYWKAGRKNEARYQWRRALLFDPEEDQVAPIQAKVERGLVGGT
jgi:tetratricopeptide (TPR) repeat protein